jgi:hypothetical protein
MAKRRSRTRQMNTAEIENGSVFAGQTLGPADTKGELRLTKEYITGTNTSGRARSKCAPIPEVRADRPVFYPVFRPSTFRTLASFRAGDGSLPWIKKKANSCHRTRVWPLTTPPPVSPAPRPARESIVLLYSSSISSSYLCFHCFSLLIVPLSPREI